MRILIYGAGVIGSLYAALFAEADVETAVLARGQRLENLRLNGLRYEKNGAVRTANVRVLDVLPKDDIYDFIFLTVRENQLHEALTELRRNKSPCIVTMVNSLEDYRIWEQLCGGERILPAFPGAGGGFEDGVLHAALTPRLIQPTTFGILSPKQEAEARQLKTLFQRAGIPYQQVKDMHAWQQWSCRLQTPTMKQAILPMSEPIAESWLIRRKRCGEISKRWLEAAFICRLPKCRCSGFYLYFYCGRR